MKYGQSVQTLSKVDKADIIRLEPKIELKVAPLRLHEELEETQRTRRGTRSSLKKAESSLGVRQPAR
jgi:hypothetical protein